MQLELGAAASPFEDRDYAEELFELLYHRDIGIGTEKHRDREQLFGIGAQQRAGIGAHRGFPAGFPRQHLLLPGGTVPPGELTRTIVRLPDRTRARPGEDPRQSF